MINKRRIWAVARVTLFLAILVGLSAWWKVRQVFAELDERALSIGRHVESWHDPEGGTSTLRVNGTRISITSVSSDDSVKAILDRFTGMCARNSGGMHDEILGMIAQGAKIPQHVADRFGVFRSEDEQQGTAACFAREGEGGVAGLYDRMEKLFETGDLAALGQLRYVFVHRARGTNSTHVLTAISHDPLPIEQIFPASGDAPGTDLLPGVRPEQARRIVSADLEGTSQRAVIYEASVGAEQALQAYDNALPGRGYERGDLSPVADDMAAPTRVYIKPDETLLIIAKDLESGSQVSAFRLANGGFVRAQM